MFQEDVPLQTDMYRVTLTPFAHLRITSIHVTLGPAPLEQTHWQGTTPAPVIPVYCIPVYTETGAYADNGICKVH